MARPFSESTGGEQYRPPEKGYDVQGLTLEEQAALRKEERGLHAQIDAILAEIAVRLNTTLELEVPDGEYLRLVG